MTDFVAVMTSDNGAFNHVKKIIEEGMFERAFLIVSPINVPSLTPSQTKVEFVYINANKPIEEMIQQIVSQLKPKLSFSEVGLNLASGNGKEHMAVLSAVMKLGVGFRLVAATKEGVKEI